MSAVLNTPSAIERFRWVTIRSGLKLEKMGMRKRGKSCRQICLQAFGLPATTSYDDLIAQCDKVIEEFS
jgi:hypothetical protein